MGNSTSSDDGNLTLADQSEDVPPAIKHLKSYYKRIFTEYSDVGVKTSYADDDWVELALNDVPPSSNGATASLGNIEAVILTNLKKEPLLIVGQGGFGKTILTKRFAGLWSAGKLSEYDLLMCVSLQEEIEARKFSQNLENNQAQSSSEEFKTPGFKTLIDLVLQSIETSLKETEDDEFPHPECTLDWLRKERTNFCHSSSSRPEGKQRTLVIIDGWNYFEQYESGTQNQWHNCLLSAFKHRRIRPAYDLLVTTQPIASIERLDINQVIVNGFDRVHCVEFIQNISKVPNPTALVQDAFERNKAFLKLWKSPRYLSYLCFCAKAKKYRPGDDIYEILMVVYSEMFKKIIKENEVNNASQILELGKVALEYLLKDSEGGGFNEDNAINARLQFEEWPECHISGILHKKFSNESLEWWFPILEAQVFFATISMLAQLNDDNRQRFVKKAREILTNGSSGICIFREFFFQFRVLMSPIQPNGNANDNPEITQHVRGQRAVNILEGQVISTLFKDVDPTELLPLISPWFIRADKKNMILAVLERGTKKMAADKLLDAIIEQFRNGDNRDQISIQKLIGALKETRKYPDLIDALENAIQ